MFVAPESKLHKLYLTLSFCLGPESTLLPLILCACENNFTNPVSVPHWHWTEFINVQNVKQTTGNNKWSCWFSRGHLTTCVHGHVQDWRPIHHSLDNIQWRYPNNIQHVQVEMRIFKNKIPHRSNEQTAKFCAPSSLDLKLMRCKRVPKFHIFSKLLTSCKFRLD